MKSKGEGKVINLLNKARIKFECEKTFGDLRHGLYRFDFYLEYKKKKCVIEINGPQHYTQQKIFHKTRKEFLSAQERDRRKISYCLANEITIYCIPYWEMDSIDSVEELFKEKYIARTRWKNDEDWRAYKEKGEGK